MKFLQIKGIWNIRYKPGKGRVPTTVSTGCRNIVDARIVAKESKIKEIELAAKANALTQGAIQTIVFGGKGIKLITVIGEYAAWMQEINRSPNTTKNSNDILKAWARFCKIEDAATYELNEMHVSKYVNRKDTTKASTRGVALSVLRKLFDWMMAKSYCQGNPAKLVRVDFTNLSHEQKEPKRKEPFTDEEYEKILKVADESDDEFWKFAIRIGRHSALRIGDIACLEWKSLDIKDGGGGFGVWTGKTDTRVTIPVSPDFLQVLLKLQKDDARFVFAAARLTYIDPETRANLSMQFKRLAEKAGVIGKSYHCLRVAKLREEANSNGIKSAQKLAGHSSPETTNKFYVSQFQNQATKIKE